MSDEKLKELESKLDEMHSDIEFLMKEHGRFTGFCYGLAGVFIIFYVVGYFDLLAF